MKSIRQALKRVADGIGEALENLAEKLFPPPVTPEPVPVRVRVD